MGIKDNDNNWNTSGHKERVVYVGENELLLFAKLFDGSNDWEQARLPVIHTETVIDVLKCFANQPKSLSSLGDGVFTSELWHETNAQKDGTIIRHTHFPESPFDMIFSGPHIGVANPMYKTSRRVCKLHSDYDSLDLINLTEEYFPRSNYSLACNIDEYLKRSPKTKWGSKLLEENRIIARKMLSQTGERTLMSCLIPKGVGHINGLLSICFNDEDITVLLAGLFSSLPYDFLLKTMGKANLYEDTAGKFPIINTKHIDEIICRSLILNCLTTQYSAIWKKHWNKQFNTFLWTKQESRLTQDYFQNLTNDWNYFIPLRTDYERRQALVEIDVLTAMALGMTLEQLKTIYRIQFPVLQQYEADTWYDANGRIVFTTNRSLVGVGFDRPTWENNVKGAPAGKVFTREIEDDTQPGGPVKRTVEYVAPFDKCDREQDYETAWKFFEEKYGKE